MRYRTRTYVDNILTTESEDSGLGASQKVAYIADDKVTGRVHTNDAGGFKFCGSFVTSTSDTFTNPSGTTTKIASNPTDTFCDGSPVFGGLGILLPQFLPGQIDNSGKNQTGATLQDNSVFKALAGTGAPYFLSGNHTITLFPGYITFDANPSHVGYPSNGVIYVDGDASVQGTYDRALTIYSTGNITVTGDINIPGFTPSAIATPSSATTVLGLATPADIKLHCNKTGSQCNPLKVVAVLNASSSSGRIYNDAWDDSKVTSSSPPEAMIYGAVISHYHPVFGSYFSQDDQTPPRPAGTLQNGWTKNLIYDTRLKNLQPPYFFRTTQANVARSTLDASSCAKDDTTKDAGGVQICQ